MSAAWVLQRKQEPFDIGLVANTKWNIPFGTTLLHSQKKLIENSQIPLWRGQRWGGIYKNKKSCSVNSESFFFFVRNVKREKGKKKTLENKKNFSQLMGLKLAVTVPVPLSSTSSADWRHHAVGRLHNQDIGGGKSSTLQHCIEGNAEKKKDNNMRTSHIMVKWI